MKYKNFVELLDDMAGRFSEKPAMFYERDGEKKSLTYKELREAVFKKTEELKADPCKCIGILLPPSPEWVITVFASAIAGKRTVLFDLSLSTDRIQLLVMATGTDKIVSYDDEAVSGLELCKSDGEYIENAGCLLFFTSGTTALNKAVVLSQKALCSSAWNGQQSLPCYETDTVLSMLPLNHVFGFVCTMLWPLVNGAAVAFGRGMRHFGDDPTYFSATIISVVPSLLKYLIAANAFDPELRCILIGASPCDQATYDAVSAKGIEVRCGYGMTETASGLAMTPVGGGIGAMDLCPDTQVRISSEGEVMVRTSCMMEGYYHNKAATDAVLMGGELATGDLGSLDENGRLTILGRKNDVLVMDNGEKIFCPEIEKELTEMLGAETAVTLKSGKLIAVCGGTEASREALLPKLDEYNMTLAMGRKVSDLAVSKSPLPKSATGKLQRWRLSALFE